MANEVDYSPCQYVGNGATKDFSFNWKVINIDELIVQLENIKTGELTTLKRGSDYSATINTIGGNVTLTTAPSADYYINISRQTSNYQSKGYSTSTGFQGSEIEKSFDTVSCCLQDMDYNIETFKTEFTDDITEQVQSFEDDINSKLTQVNDAVNQLNRLDEVITECESCAEIAQNSAGTAEKAAEAAENMADRNLSNLTNTGKSQYNPFCINTGVTDENGNPACLVLDGNTLMTQGTFICSTSSGTIYEISDVLTLDISSYDDGDYNVFIDPVEKTLSILNNTVHTGNTFPSGAVTGDYLLNTSKVPYSLDQLTANGTVTGLNAVWAGVLTISGGG